MKCNKKNNNNHNNHNNNIVVGTIIILIILLLLLLLLQCCTCHTEAYTHSSPMPPKEVPKTSHNVGKMKSSRVFCGTVCDEQKIKWTSPPNHHVIIITWSPSPSIIIVSLLHLYEKQRTYSRYLFVLLCWFIFVDGTVVALSAREWEREEERMDNNHTYNIHRSHHI